MSTTIRCLSRPTSYEVFAYGQQRGVVGNPANSFMNSLQPRSFSRIGLKCRITRSRLCGPWSSTSGITYVTANRCNGQSSLVWSNSATTGTPSAEAILAMFCRDGLRLPLSIPARYERWIPASAAIRSWFQLLASRKCRTRRPNCCSMLL